MPVFWEYSAEQHDDIGSIICITRSLFVCAATSLGICPYHGLKPLEVGGVEHKLTAHLLPASTVDLNRSGVAYTGSLSGLEMRLATISLVCSFEMLMAPKGDDKRERGGGEGGGGGSNGTCRVSHLFFCFFTHYSFNFYQLVIPYHFS